MKKAYKKALRVIDSCTNYQQVMGAYNFIWNFRRLFEDTKGCTELTQKLHDKCHLKRKLVGDK
jgi:hypothetical protein